jgi:hypothetical protein
MSTEFPGEELVGVNALITNMSLEEIARRATTNYSDEQLFNIYTTVNDPVNPVVNEAEGQTSEANTIFSGEIPPPSGKQASVTCFYLI